MKRVIGVAVLALSSMVAQADQVSCKAVQNVTRSMITTKLESDPHNEIRLDSHVRNTTDGYVEMMSSFFGTPKWEEAKSLIDAAEWLRTHATVYYQTFEQQNKLQDNNEDVVRAVSESMFNKCYLNQ